MIRAVLRADPDGHLTGFEIKGHSGYAEEGSDIVCSAVSILSVTCLNSLESLCGIRPAVKGGEDGYLSVRLPADLSAEQTHDAQILLGMLRQGLKDLADEYPKYVQFSILNGGKQP